MKKLLLLLFIAGININYSQNEEIIRWSRSYGAAIKFTGNETPVIFPFDTARYEKTMSVYSEIDEDIELRLENGFIGIRNEEKFIENYSKMVQTKIGLNRPIKNIKHLNSHLSDLAFGAIDYENYRFINSRLYSVLQFSPKFTMDGDYLYDEYGNTQYEAVMSDGVHNSGVYDLENNEWLIHPQYDQIYMTNNGFLASKSCGFDEASSSIQYQVEQLSKQGEVEWSLKVYPTQEDLNKVLEKFVSTSDCEVVSSAEGLAVLRNKKNSQYFLPHHELEALCGINIHRRINSFYADAILYVKNTSKLLDWHTTYMKNDSLVIDRDKNGDLIIGFKDVSAVKFYSNFGDQYFIRERMNGDIDTFMVNIGSENVNLSVYQRENKITTAIKDTYGQSIDAEGGLAYDYEGNPIMEVEQTLSLVYKKVNGAYEFLVEGYHPVIAKDFTAYILSENLDMDKSLYTYQFIDDHGKSISHLTKLGLNSLIELNKGSHFVGSTVDNNTYLLDKNGKVVSDEFDTYFFEDGKVKGAEYDSETYEVIREKIFDTK